MEEAAVFGRSRRDPCLEHRIGDREAFAGFGQRIIIEPGRLRRLELRRQTLHLLGREMHEQRRAAGVGGTAGEPALAKAVGIDALVCREDRLRCQQFYYQRRSEGGDGVTRLIGAGGDEGGDAISRAGRNAR